MSRDSLRHRWQWPVEAWAEVRRRDWIPGLLLLLLTLVAYQRALHLGYIWDDDSYVTGNTLLRDGHGLGRIWFDVRATPQYYPLVHTTFWLEYHLWGLGPAGYHAVNVLLHALAGVLLWRVLVWLRLPGAWLAAAIFSLHPVAVESVAWITERKNVLSAVFYFAAALADLRFAAARETGVGGRRPLFLYLLSLGLFVLALLSKTVTASLPAALLLVTWWKSGRVRKQEVVALLPFFAMGLGLGMITAWLEQHHVGAEGAAWSLTPAQRCLIAGRALWFYAGKLVWPSKLTFIYPRWESGAGLSWDWLWPVAAVATAGILWWKRDRIGRGPLVAVLFFAGTLVPALGFLNVYPFRYSYVADHFQYLAAVGLIALGAVGLSRLPRLINGILLALLMVLTWRQIGIYRNLETLWRDTLEKNPASWMAQTSFAAVLLGKGMSVEAISHFNKAIELAPDNVEPQNDLGYALLQMGRAEEALPYLQKALQLDPNRAVVQCNLGNALLRVGRVDDSLAHLRRALELDPGYGAAHFGLANTLLQLGRVDEALLHLQKTLTLNSQDPDAQKNMAWVLATWPEARIRDGRKAMQLAEDANNAVGGTNPVMAVTLAAAYAEAGRFPEAIRTAERARQLAADSGNAALVEVIDGHISLYRSGRPVRDVR